MLTVMLITSAVLLIVPFFLIHNGVVMIRREGRHLAHMLSLLLGIVILIGEAATIALVLNGTDTFDAALGVYRTTPLHVAVAPAGTARGRISVEKRHNN